MPTINGNRSLTPTRSNVSPSVIDTLAKRVTALFTTYSQILSRQDSIDEKLISIENDIVTLASTPSEALDNIVAHVADVKEQVLKLQADLLQVVHVTETVERGLNSIGISTVSELAKADPSVVSEGIKGIGPKKAEAMIADAQAIEALEAEE